MWGEGLCRVTGREALPPTQCLKCCQLWEGLEQPPVSSARAVLPCLGGAQACLWEPRSQRQRGRVHPWVALLVGSCQHHLSTCGPHCSQLWKLASLSLAFSNFPQPAQFCCHDPRPPGPQLFSLCGERREILFPISQQLSPRENPTVRDAGTSCTCALALKLGVN